MAAASGDRGRRIRLARAWATPGRRVRQGWTSAGPARHAPAARDWAWPVVAAEGATASFAAAIPWLGAYRMAGVATVLALAAVLPAAVTALVVVVWRRGPPFSYVSSAVALVVLLLAAVSADPAGVARGLATGPSHLLTDTLPLTSPRWLLAPAVVVTWLTAAAVAELLARTRGTGPALAVVAASYLTAYAAASGAPSPPVASGALLLGAGALLAMTRWLLGRPAPTTAGGGPSPPSRRSHSALSGGALMAVAAVACWLAVPHLPGLGSHGASLNRRPPTVRPLATSPVDVIASLRDDHPSAPPRPMVVVRTNASSTGYLPVAVLDNYDGATWTFDRTFEPTGGRIPPPPHGAPPVTGPSVRHQIDMLHPLGPAVPLIPYGERPTRVTGLTVDADATTGMIVPASALHFPQRYTVDSRAAAVSLAGLAPTARFADAGDRSDLQLPADVGTDLTPTLRFLAAVTGQRPAPTVAFLQAVAGVLQRDDRRIDPLLSTTKGAPPTRGGTSLAEVVSATTVSREATPEQFATLLVVVARTVGVPARLATGFRVAPPSGPLLDAGAYTVTNRQAWTWAEVPVAGVGWVVADPTPSATATKAPPPPIAAATPPTTTSPKANALPANAPGNHALAPAVHPRRQARSSLSPALLAGVGVAAALVVIAAGFFTITAGRRAVRRWRRHRADARRLAVGAWLELLDGLARAGLVPGRSATSAEVAALAAASFGPDLEEPVRSVGELADRAVCSTRAVVDRAAAARAWRVSHDVGHTVVSRLPRAERARARVRVGYHPRRPVAPTTMAPTTMV